MKHIKSVETILYVADQEKSKSFYEKLFRKAAELHVPGMTEFNLSHGVKLGLMPSEGIVNILGDKINHPETAHGVPRCELYFQVEDIESEYENALKIGAQLIDPISERNWGDRVCYFIDLDGHIIAFAEPQGK